MHTSTKEKLKKQRITALIVIIAIIVISFLSFSVIPEIGGGKGEGKFVAINITEGQPLSEIALYLEKQGIISHPTWLKIYSKFSSKSDEIKMGLHYFKRGMSYSNILKELSTSPASEGVLVTIPEGYEFNMIADMLDDLDLIDKEKFCDLAENYDFDYDFVKQIPERKTRLEGYLYPDTYYITKEEDELAILNMMLQQFDANFTEDLRKEASEEGMSIDQVVNLASIIQREAANNEEMPLVSSVFHNRLNSDEYPCLQSCATVQYILSERKPVLSIQDTEIDSPYNTYMYPGLPIGPIASPSIDAIKAALEPQKTNYYFFYADENGETFFSETLKEHNDGAYK